ncbi:MAG: hypothetical protein Q8O94_02655 [bacterium]|nr:hypothetical protein [bacterium]
MDSHTEVFGLVDTAQTSLGQALLSFDYQELLDYKEVVRRLINAIREELDA